jgi:hypothetical protein
LAELDASFFRVQFDRLTPSEKHSLRAMAELGLDLIAWEISPTVWGDASLPSRRCEVR